MLDQEPLGTKDRRSGSVFEKWFWFVDYLAQLDPCRLRNACQLVQGYGKSRVKQKSGCGEECGRIRLLLGNFSGCR